MTVLLEASDVEHLRKPIDFARINQSVDGTTIEFLLDARRRVGPIGAYCERLYRERRGEELERFAKSMSDHGVPESQTYLDAEAAREMVLACLPAALRSTQPDDLVVCAADRHAERSQEHTHRPARSGCAHEPLGLNHGSSSRQGRRTPLTRCFGAKIAPAGKP